jgi:hypothetical protein
MPAIEADDCLSLSFVFQAVYRLIAQQRDNALRLMALSRVSGLFYGLSFVICLFFKAVYRLIAQQRDNALRLMVLSRVSGLFYGLSFVFCRSNYMFYAMFFALRRHRKPDALKIICCHEEERYFFPFLQVAVKRGPPRGTAGNKLE